MATGEHQPGVTEEQPGVVIPFSPTSITDSNKVGYLLSKGSFGDGEKIPVFLTDSNAHLFYLNEGEYQRRPQGSMEIIDFLNMYSLNQEVHPEAISEAAPFERHLAFFDINGDFHDYTLFKKTFRLIRDGEKKDAALFDIRIGQTDDYEETVVAIDDIYCVTGAIPPAIREEAKKLGSLTLAAEKLGFLRTARFGDQDKNERALTTTA